MFSSVPRGTTPNPSLIYTLVKQIKVTLSIAGRVKSITARENSACIAIQSMWDRIPEARCAMLNEETVNTISHQQLTDAGRYMDLSLCNFSMCGFSVQVPSVEQLFW